MNNNVVETPFPSAALIPKAETGALSFLQKYPEFDGRNVTIAIFDSGVDPRAAGLQTLCDGKTVKVIERYDCSGCGDTDTSKKVIANAKGEILGLSGRSLKLTEEMIQNNTAAGGEFRVGVKNFHDICPSKVRDNLMNCMKVKQWDSSHKIAIADAVRKINEFDAENSDASKLSWEKKLIKENLDSKLELLNNYEKIFLDIEVSYDCVVYPTGKGWQVVIDTTEKGDLENALHIGEYNKTYEVKNIDDYLSISVNVHDNGDVLEIVGMCSSHGTHVASIASANKSCDDVDGVAPNAKIVSLTIGDGRLGSMETGTALVRAMIKVMELCRTGRKIDIINMSYGEHSHWSNTGPRDTDKKKRKKRKAYLSRIGELMNEVVNKYGVVWVASAGNSGPALSTVGTPPDISQPSCIGVGAYVSPQMMESEYAMRDKLPANVYSWTSRDPCIDGGRAVTICAPGGAIASVPQFTMSKAQLMNGTSMAAPNAAGSIALLLSGLKQRGIEYSPFSIKRAISATATYLNHVDPFAQGHGLLNVEKAFEHLVQYQDEPENMLRFSVRVGPQNAKGIHLREGFLQRPYEFGVLIEPVIFNELEAEAEKKYNFNVRLNLIATESFVQCGSFLDLNYGARNLSVKVDPTGLPPGVHAAYIMAYDTKCVQKGPLFEIPVTIVQPHVLNIEETRTFEPVGNGSNIADGSILFQPNTIRRDFILVPKDATWAVLRMRASEMFKEKDVGKFFVHTVQLLPKKNYNALETMKSFTVTADNESTLTFKVAGNNILELCIAKHWANYGNINLKYKLEFHGLRALNPEAVVMHAGRGIHRLDITALSMEETQPQIQLKNAVQVLRPTETKISPLSGKRDVVPEGRQIYQNVLTYNLTLTKAAEVTLYSPFFNKLLYEAEFESNMWMMFDSGKCLVCTGDSFTEKSVRKLEKGEYVIKMQIRHEKRELLEKINEATMVVSVRLAAPISLDIYDHYNQCLISGKKFSTCMVRSSLPKVLYVAPLMNEKFAKIGLPNNCAWLSGPLTLAKDDGGKRVDVHEFLYVLNPAEAKKTNGNNNGNNNNTNSTTTTATAVVVGTKPPLIPPQENTTPTSAGDGGVLTERVVAATTTNAENNENTTSATSSTTMKKGKTADDYDEALRDFQCGMISKCELEQAEKIYEELLAKHPKHLAAHINLIQNLEGTQPKTLFPFTFVKVASGTQANVEEIDVAKMKILMKRIADLAELVINGIEHDSLLAYYGMKNDTRPDASKIKANMDKQRAQLVEALVKRGVALSKYYALENTLKEHLNELDNIYLEIIKFNEIHDNKVLLFALWHAYAHNQYGRMYKYLQKMFDEKRCRELFEELHLVVHAMQYSHLAPVVRRRTISTFPAIYSNF